MSKTVIRRSDPGERLWFSELGSPQLRGLETGGGKTGAGTKANRDGRFQKSDFADHKFNL